MARAWNGTLIRLGIILCVLVHVNSFGTPPPTPTPTPTATPTHTPTMPLPTGSHCRQQSTCNTCIQYACIWCNIDNTCANNQTECKTPPFFFNYAPPNVTCSHYTKPNEKCTEKLTIHTDIPNEITNMVEGGFSDQPIIGIPASIVPLGSINREKLIVPDVGFYIVPPTNATLKFLPATRSMIAYGEIYDYNQTVNGIKYSYLFAAPDIGIMAEPNREYSFGYVVCNNGTCSFANSTVVFTVNSAYTQLYDSVNVYVGIPFYFVMIIILTIFSNWCPWESELDDEEIEDVIDDMVIPLEETEQKILQPIETIREIATQSEQVKSPEPEQVKLEVKEKPSILWSRTSKFSRDGLKKFFKFYEQGSLFSVAGADSLAIWRSYVSLLVVSTIVGALSLAILLPIDELLGRKYAGAVYGDFAKVSMGAMATFSFSALSHVTLMSVYPILGAIIFFVMSRIYRQIQGGEDITKSDAPPKQRTIAVQGINQLTVQVIVTDKVPYIEKTTHIKKYEEELYLKFGGSDAGITGVFIPIRFGAVLGKLSQKHHIESLLKLSLDSRTKTTLLRQLEIVNKEIVHFMQKRHFSLKTEKTAFITYEQDTQVANGIARIKREKYSVYKPPSEDEIRWNMLETTWKDWALRCVAAALILLFVGTIIAVDVLYIINGGYYGIMYITQKTESRTKIVGAGTTRSVAVSYLVTLFPYIVTLGISILNEYMANFAKLTTYFERHTSNSAFAFSYVIKTTLYMVQITLLFPYIFDVMLLAGNSVSIFHSASTDTFYINAGIRMANYLISQTFFSYGITLAIHAILVVIKFVIAKFKRLREVERLEYDYITGYSKGATVIAFLFQFGGLIPILWFLGILFFIVQCVSQRWLLMFFYKKTPKHLSKVAHGNLMDRIMQIGIIVCPLISLIVAAYQSPSGPGTDYNTLSLKVFSIMYLLVVIAFAILASIIYQVWRRRRRPILKETGDVPKKRDKYQHPLCGSSFVLGNVVQKPEQQII